MPPPRARPSISDRDLRHRPEALHHLVKEIQLGGLGPRLLREGLDQRHIGMGDEEIGVGALEDDYPQRRIRLELGPQLCHVPHQLQVEQIDRRMVDADHGHTAFGVNPQTFELLEGHRGLLVGLGGGASRQRPFQRAGRFWAKARVASAAS